jgi:translation initiation factor 2-alpha kinase 4
MIYEICQEIQEFLYEHNKPPPKSFYDQMLDNKKKQEFYNEQQQQLDACLFDIERKKFEEEHVS